MRVAFIGCVAFSNAMLTRLAGWPDAEIVGVVTRRNSAFNADFQCLAPTAQKIGVPCLEVDGNDQQQMADWLRVLDPDVIYCVGWSYLLYPQILELAPKGVVGYHPTLLPRNRGRHPIIWALALGLSRTGSTFFLMDESADSGPILDQRAIAIDANDNAASLYAKLTAAAGEQLGTVTAGLAGGTIEATPQDPNRASYWRKRTATDGRIDWRMPAEGIYNLIRALHHPYPGAYCVLGADEVKIWQAEIEPHGPADAEPGRVMSVRDHCVTVKCGTHAVTLLEHEFPTLPEPGAYL